MDILEITYSSIPCWVYFMTEYDKPILWKVLAYVAQTFSSLGMYSITDNPSNMCGQIYW